MSLYEEHPGRAAQQGLGLWAGTCEEERRVTAPFLQGQEEERGREEAEGSERSWKPELLAGGGTSDCQSAATCCVWWWGSWKLGPL